MSNILIHPETNKKQKYSIQIKIIYNREEINAERVVT